MERERETYKENEYTNLKMNSEREKERKGEREGGREVERAGPESPLVSMMDASSSCRSS